MKIILNADDYGLSESVNKGITECLKEGWVTGATLMMNTPYTDHAIEIIKENNFQNIGVHLNLTYGKSVLPKEEVPTLVDENGVFHYVCMLGYYTQYLDAKKELKAQVEKFLAAGLTPSHLDHHHYFHEVPAILKAYLEIAKEYNLPVRSMSHEARDMAREMGVKTTDEFSFAFHDWGVGAETMQTLMKLYGDKDITLEVMTTPGYIDEYTQRQTKYLCREKEIEVLKEIKQKGILEKAEKISFKEL